MHMGNRANVAANHFLELQTVMLENKPELFARICKPNHVEHVAILLESLQHCTFHSILLFLLYSFLNNSPAFYNFWQYSIVLGERRATKCGASEGMPYIKACWEEKTKMIYSASKTDAVWYVFWTKIRSTLPMQDKCNVSFLKHLTTFYFQASLI